MFTRILTLICVCSFSSILAQEYRTFDGTGNNVNNPDWGATHTQQLRMAPNDYNNSFSTPGGQDRPNPRTISNTVFQQDSLIMDGLALSDYIWVWGQFIDHDITLVKDSETEPAMIPVPQGDPWFDPFNTGQMMIPMMRNEIMDGTGTSISNPREHPNFITAFVDGSMVYGSDDERADWLRTFEDGKLVTSTGNLLPFNTIDKQQFSALNPNAPEMDDAVGISPKHFVAGDIRANENPLLASFHILFVREHNRICEELLIAHPDWNDEEIYQHARAMVIGFIQNITFNEWLPAMGVHLPTYTSYDPTVNPSIFNVFSGAAFRLGHTLISGNIRRMDMDGNTIPQGDITLAEAFFNPWIILNDGGIDPLLKGMGAQIQQDMDVQVVSDVRNFLFGPPGAGGLDLAAININRGRERGIPDFNTIRVAFGLDPINSFDELTGDHNFAQKLEGLYQSVDKVDAWVGMLAEKHMSDALFGETIMKIMEAQFGRLRDGDRFYFLNDPNLSDEEKDEISNTPFGEIVERNTSIPIMQDNVFYAMPHEMICQADVPFANVSVSLDNNDLEAIDEVSLQLEELSTANTNVLMVDGGYEFLDLSTCNGYKITAEKDDNHGNGVTTFDLVLIRKHILAAELLDNPIALLAADVNQSETITTFDLVNIRKIILNPNATFDNSPSWRFFPSDIVFSNPANPWATDLPDHVIIDNLLDATLVSFTGFKVGDVNFSADANGLNAADDRSNETFVFHAPNQLTQKDELVSLTLNANDLHTLAGYQFTLDYDASVLDFQNIEYGDLPELSADNFYVMPEAGAITTSWNSQIAHVDKLPAFTVNFKAKETGKALSDLIGMSSRYTSAEAINNNLDVISVDLSFEEDITIVTTTENLIQSIQPNPFKTQTNIQFELPEADAILLTVFDALGKQIYVAKGQFAAGKNQWTINRKDLPTTGVIFCQLETSFGTFMQKAVIQD